MRRSVAMAILVLGLAGCGRATAVTSGARVVPNPDEHLLPGNAVLIKQPIVDAKVDPRDEDFERRQNFARARAYPGEADDADVRRKALEAMLTMPLDLRPPRSCSWVTAGPTNINGRVTGLAIDPKNRERMFVSTVGGIWRTLDGGKHWAGVSDDFASAATGAVAINPANPREVFAGGGDPNLNTAGATTSNIGIWQSVAGGDPGTWRQSTPSDLRNEIVYRIRIDPAGTNDVYAATSGGVYVGRHHGPNVIWTQLGDLHAWVSDIAVDFSVTPRTVWAGVRTGKGRGVWKWNGTAWAHSSSGIPTISSSNIALAIAASAPQTLYAKVAADSGDLQGVYRTDDGGATWATLPSSALDDCWYTSFNSVIEVDPANANVVYAGSMNLYRSTDGGQTWVSISAGADKNWPQSIHVDQHAIVFDPADRTIIYSGNDGGVMKSSDMSLRTWRWNDVSHGMRITQFYNLATQLASTTLIAGGSQDNGTEITFGNYTWYNPGMGDSIDVALDSGDSSTLYATSTNLVYGFANPVPYTTGGLTTLKFKVNAGQQLTAPVASNPTPPARHALTVGAISCGQPQLMKTTDGLNWTGITTLPYGARVNFIAAAPRTSFARHYVGLVYSAPPSGCPLSATPFQPVVWRTTNGGGVWLTSTKGVPNGFLMNVATDLVHPDRAFLAAGNAGVALTIDGGSTWTPLTGNLPAATFVTDVAIDPTDETVLYLATDVGVFRGRLNIIAGSAMWAPFNDGLPHGALVTDIEANPVTKLLTIGTLGRGAYQRDVSPGATCDARRLLVRDNVFDRGGVPSPSDLPDPEHPILNKEHPPFYKPDDTPGGRLYWWTSTDIRTAVPALDPPQNRLATVDHVQFETCPIDAAKCPVDSLLDSAPQRGLDARTFVQVSNRGTVPIHDVRVIVLYTPAGAGAPRLPDDFWTRTFPASGGCGPLDTSTGWRLVDEKTPCRTIPFVGPDMPEVAAFDWKVPADAPKHSCFLTIIESRENALDPSIRRTNERRVHMLAPWHPQIAIRNLHPIDAPLDTNGEWEFADVLILPDGDSNAPVDLDFSAVGVEEAMHIILPTTSGVDFEGLPLVDGALSEKELELIREYDLDRNAVFALTEGVGKLRVPAGRQNVWRIALEAKTDQQARLSVVASQGGQTLGGSTFILRGRDLPHVERTK